jgi:AcrR family transcriptional regulator
MTRALSKALKADPSLRDARKKRTRRALREAAHELFAAQGYDTTTTEEIAEKAGVSPRTFFRYFPTKESVLFSGEHAWLQSFAGYYLNQPDSLSDAEAMCAALVAAGADFGLSRPALRQYKRALASSPTLRGREADHQEQDAEQVAKAIADRRGLPYADETCAVLAAVGVLTFRRALDVWLAGPARIGLSDVIVEEFGLLAQSFNEIKAGGPAPRGKSARSPSQASARRSAAGA